METVRVDVTLLSTLAGGRKRAVTLLGGYRPHIRVDNGEHLGVILVAEDAVLQSDAVALLHPGESTRVDLKLPYEVDYSALRAGVDFSILEGPRVVGFGRVLEVPTGENRAP